MKLFVCLLFVLNVGNVSFAATRTYWGEKISVGKGYAWTYIKVINKTPQAMGVAISPKGLTGLSHEMVEYTLPMPKHIKVRPYRHIAMDWNPHGHEPGGVYDVPHFDFHFYFISEKLRQSISCVDEDAAICMKSPDEDSLVANYAPTPAGVPKMGWHWVDLLAPEFNGGQFTRTFIYGYYDGNLIFIEPMVTTDYLLSKKSSINPIRQPKQFPYQEGRYPKKYKVYYDAVNKLHKVELINFREQNLGITDVMAD
ncbi:MAG: hypothetical protein NDI69_01900 [Bacteriovoracaceae bacterium]|nr:hypothetical protein [Bacteriovoracaceae bacterium]